MPNGLLRRALGLVVELDEQQPAKATAPRPVMSSVQSVTVAQPAMPLTSEQVNKFTAHFEQLFQGANLPGPDYYDWDQMVATLEPDIPSEDARMKAAFRTLSKQGLTKEKLLDTARQYIKVVEAEREQFAAEVESKNVQEIQPKAALVDPDGNDIK